MTGDSSARERIVHQRMKLRERFLRKMQQSPAAADPKPQGSGPPNHHGMPKLPVGQTETRKWPVLDLGTQPEISLDDWELQVDGACEHPLRLNWKDFRALELVEDISDFHCVTTWSRMDIAWRGVRVSEILALAEPREDASHLLCHGYDGYTTNLPLEEALKDDVLLVFEADGRPLPREHGGDDHAATLRVEGSQVDQATRDPHRRSARFLGAKRIFQHRASVARRSLQSVRTGRRLA